MYINITDKQLKVSEGITVPQVLQLTLSAQLQIMQGFLAEAEKNQPEDYEHMRASIYDMFNKGAGEVLDRIFPDAKPNLTAEAILKAENEILDALPTVVEVEDPKARDASIKEALKVASQKLPKATKTQ